MDAEHNQDFLNWVEERHFIDSYFTVYKDTLLTLFKDEVPESRYKAICASVKPVIDNCDGIDYNPDQVVAYIIIHFLDRYYRFWLTYCNLIGKGLFPDKPQMRMIDIGTGPGPSMYAYSDIMWLLNQYKEAHGMEPSQFTIDYAEQSEGFRYFLHQFTERLVLPGHPSSVPFHHGTYSDAHAFDLSGTVKWHVKYPIWDDLKQKNVEIELTNQQYAARSFNLIVYSNFLTNEDMVNTFADQIAKAAFWLRNGGLLVIVGANPDDSKYRSVYTRIDEIINGQHYSNRYYVGGCRKVFAVPERMSYSPNCPISMQKGLFYKEVFELFDNEDYLLIPEDMRSDLKKDENGQGKMPKWWLAVYRRHSRWRRP